MGKKNLETKDKMQKPPNIAPTGVNLIGMKKKYRNTTLKSTFEGGMSGG